jgi:hypothetical protein
MPADATGNGSTGSSPTQGEASELLGITPLSDDTATPVETTLSSNGSEPMATPDAAPAATESQPQDE